MIYVCDQCNEEVSEESRTGHEVRHAMSDMGTMLSRQDMYHLASDLTHTAVLGNKPVSEVIAVYKEMVRRLMESGIF